MALEISYQTMEEIFDNLVGIKTSGNGATINIGGISGSSEDCKFIFEYPKVYLSTYLMVPIKGGTTVDSFYVSKKGSSVSFKVVLEGDEIKTFDYDGIYVINSLEIRMEGN